MKIREKLAELSQGVQNAEVDLVWAKEELEKQPENLKFINQKLNHETALTMAKERFDDLKSEIEEQGYKLDDEWFDESAGGFQPMNFVINRANPDDDEQLK